jgi:hypothetical protein
MNRHLLLALGFAVHVHALPEQIPLEHKNSPEPIITAEMSVIESLKPGKSYIKPFGELLGTTKLEDAPFGATHIPNIGLVFASNAKVLGVKDGGNSVLDLRLDGVGRKTTILGIQLKNDLDANGKDASPATATWTNSSGGSDAAIVDAALQIDIFRPNLVDALGGYNTDEQGVAFHYLLGAEWDYSNTDGEERDTRGYRLGASFAPAGKILPQSAKIEKWGFRDNVSFIVDYEEDRVTAADRTSFALKWGPVMVFGSDKDNPTFMLGAKNYFRFDDLLAFADGQTETSPDRVTQLVSTTGVATQEETERSPRDRLHYLSVTPDISIDAGDGSAPDSLDEFENSLIKASADVLLSFNADRIKLSYRVDACNPISDLGDTRLGHKFALDIQPYTRSSVRFFAQYQKGEFSPSFIDQEFTSIGIGVRF